MINFRFRPTGLDGRHEGDTLVLRYVILDKKPNRPWRQTLRPRDDFGTKIYETIGAPPENVQRIKFDFSRLFLIGKMHFRFFSVYRRIL